jgi:hypothetical protein
MRPLGDERLHMRLLEEMSQAVGADLVRAYQDGLISNADWAEMVQQCRGCSEPGKCRKWLDAQETAPEAPAYCSNSEQLDALKAALAPEEKP